jgi:hypothetical protein
MGGAGPSGRAAAAAGGSGMAATVNTGVAAAAGQLYGSSSQLEAGMAGAAAAGGAGSMGGSSMGPAGVGGGVMGVTGSALREDVFKAYIDQHMQVREANCHQDDGVGWGRGWGWQAQLHTHVMVSAAGDPEKAYSVGPCLMACFACSFHAP